MKSDTFTSNNLTNAHLLIVDDDPALLHALSQTLIINIPQISIDTAISVQDALSFFHTTSYDVIISDIRMPGLDGFDLLAHIQELQPDLPFILITGHGEQDASIRALRDGAYDYVLKPINRYEFISTIKRAIHTSRLRQKVKEQQKSLEQRANDLTHKLQEQLQEIQDKNTKLQAANKAKEHIIHMVIHELAGPFTSILGSVQMMRHQVQKGLDREKLLQNLTTTENVLLRLKRLLEDLQDTTLIQQQQFTLNRKPHDIVKVCQNILDEFTNNRTPQPEISGEFTSINVSIDEMRICQVILNLLTNARKYSPDQTPILITLQQATTTVTIAVRDYGIGISEEVQNRIYEQFYRVPEIDAEKTISGFGLGLYITQAIVEQHGGQINVESTPDVGSRFSVTLPLLETVPAHQTTLSLAWTLEPEIVYD